MVRRPSSSSVISRTALRWLRPLLPLTWIPSAMTSFRDSCPTTFCGPKSTVCVRRIPSVASSIGNNHACYILFLCSLSCHLYIYTHLGKKFIYWYGSEPRLCLTDTDMIKELLSSKYVQHTGKSWLQRQGSKNLIGDGLLMANGSNWFHQRHVVAPAFMADKLKVRILLWLMD